MLELGSPAIARLGGALMSKRRRRTPKEAFEELLYFRLPVPLDATLADLDAAINPNWIARLTDFGQKCSGIEIRTRKVEGDWPQDIPLLPVGDDWEAIDTVTVLLRDSDAYAVIKWLDGGEVDIRIHNERIDRAASETVKLKAAIASVSAIVRAGRPHGTGMFPNASAFMAMFGLAVRELRRKGQNPTSGNVLKALRTRLGKVDPSQLTRWHQRFGWRRWQDFLDDVE